MKMAPPSSGPKLRLPGGPVSVDISHTLRTLWRRRLFLIGCMIIAAGIAGVLVSRMQPIYTATAKVIIEGRSSKLSELQQYAVNRVPTFMAVASEVEVIESRDLARRVADTLNLYADPEFNPTLPNPTKRDDLLSTVFGLIGQVREAVFGASEPLVETPEQREARIQRMVVDAIMTRLTATAVQQSVVVMIEFNSTNATKSARIANSIAEHYVTSQLEAKFDAIRRTTTWLTDRLDSLRQAVSDSESAVADYRRNRGLIDTDGRLPSQQNLADLNAQLIVAQGRRAEEQARVARIESLMRAGRGMDAVSEVVDSPLIQRLKEQEATLARQASDLTTRYGDRHPEMAKIRAEQAEIQSKIDAEVSKVAQGLRNELSVLQAREANLQANISALEKTILTQSEAQIRLRELEREAQANRSLYEAFLSRFKESGDQEEIQQPDARIISTAEEPRIASRPRRGLIMAAAGLLGLFAGIVITLLSEQFNRTLRNREELEELSGVPVIGQIPHVRTLPGRSVSEHLVAKPHSGFAEAFRISWFSLKNLDPDSDPKVVLVSSAVPEEGKSLTSLSLARTAANLGLRVALVDMDLRRPSLSKTMAVDVTCGIRDLLAGQVTLDEAMIKDPHSSVEALLSAEGSSRAGLDLEEAKAVGALIETLRNRYDAVIVDSPPTLPVADAQLLGRLADRTIFCVRWDKTPRESVAGALRILSDAHINVSGMLLTRVLTRKYASYGYGDMGYYYGKYSGYYSK